MRSTKKIRDIFGISQQELAIFLGVSRSQIGLAETGRRELPTGALLQLSRLESSLHNNIEYEMPVSKTQSGKELAVLKLHAKSCTHKAAKARQQLAALQQEHQHCTKAMLALGHLLHNPPEGKRSEKEKLWLELHYNNKKRLLSKCGLPAQVIISLKIQTLDAEAQQALALKF